MRSNKNQLQSGKFFVGGSPSRIYINNNRFVSIHVIDDGGGDNDGGDDVTSSVDNTIPTI